MSVVLAAIGANAFWLLYVWLASAIVCQVLAEQKGYSEKAGLGTGLFLSALGIPIWLLMRPKANSKWAHRKARRRAKAGRAPADIAAPGDTSASGDA
jgi:hypothetical protein